MPTRGQAKKAQERVTPAPPFYIAETDLPPGAGGVIPRAFAPGDRVPSEHVERNGWHDLVRDPFAGATTQHVAAETGDGDQGTPASGDAANTEE